MDLVWQSCAKGFPKGLLVIFQDTYNDLYQMYTLHRSLYFVNHSLVIDQVYHIVLGRHFATTIYSRVENII